MAESSSVSRSIAGRTWGHERRDRRVVGVAADSGRLLWKVPFTTEYTQNR
jgi:hypothetical protein